MITRFVFAALLVALAGQAVSAAGQAKAGPTPVLVELFTSEGCSSCPPADAFIQKLDEQPFPGAQMIVLSEHVDYWDHLGWRDVYSSHSLTERQNDYAQHFGLNSSYTPQIVVDGTNQFVGNDARSAQDAFEKAEKAPKLPVHIVSAATEPDGTVRVQVEVPGLPEASVVRSADVIVVLALNRAVSQVKRGENQGRELSHVAVVREFIRAGTVKRGESFQKDVRLMSKPVQGAQGLRVIAFVQASGPGAVLGAALKQLP